MPYRVTTASTFIPVTTAEVKPFLNIDAAYTAKDCQLEAFVVAAKGYVERYTKRQIGQNTVEEYYDTVPDDDIFTLSTGLVASVTSVSYWNGTAWVALAGTDYYLDNISVPAQIELLNSFSPSGRTKNLWKIVYLAGAVDGADIPGPLLTCIKMLVAFWNENTTDQDITDLNYIHTILKQYVLNP